MSAFHACVMSASARDGEPNIPAIGLREGSLGSRALIIPRVRALKQNIPVGMTSKRINRRTYPLLSYGAALTSH
jgi:hypothetical protein